MFKNMKLGTKISLGYFVLVLIAGILGVVGWKGVTEIDEDMHILNNWSNIDMVINEAVIQKALHVSEAMAEYHMTRKKADFDNLIAEIEVLDKGIDEWQALVKHEPELTKVAEDEHDSVDEYRKDCEEYESIVKQEDEIAAKWDRTLMQAIQRIEKSMEDVVDPAKEVAAKGTNVEELAKWADVDMSANEKVIANLLKLETITHEFIAHTNDENWNKLTASIETAKEGTSEWQELVTGIKKELGKTAETVAASLKEYGALSLRYHTLVDKIEELDEHSDKMIEKIISRLEDAMENTIDPAKEEAVKKADAAQEQSAMFSLILTSAGIVLGIILAFVITRSITKPLNRVIEGMSQGAEQVASASGQVSSGSQNIAQGASEQASSLEEVSSSLEEMSSMTQQNSDNANSARDLSEEASGSAQQGNQAMGNMSKTITEIQTSANDTARIVKTIDEIAFQTNLLALNAAVEAARAGEAGAGFAVVAEEVRNLAQRSAEAARDTANLIEQSQKNAEEGVTASTEVEEILGQIVEKVQKASQLIAEVSAASDEQTRGVEQITEAVTQMNQVTQSNAANAEESSSSSEELSAQAQELFGRYGTVEYKSLFP
ncbi:methyl-accepting chemotaxis protein [Planctomycetota bacterium]